MGFLDVQSSSNVSNDIIFSKQKLLPTSTSKYKPIFFTPNNFLVLTRINLIVEEIVFLCENRVIFISLEDQVGLPNVVLADPFLLELRIDVDAFMETPNFVESTQHLKSRNSKAYYSKYTRFDDN